MNKDIKDMNKADLNQVEDVTVDLYEEWREAQPESPISDSLRLPVRGAYDMQEDRIRQGNRLFAHFRSRLGLKPDESEDSDVEAAKAINRLREEFDKITEGVPGVLARGAFKANGVFHSYTEYVMVASFLDLFKAEKAVFKSLDVELKNIPIYKEFLLGVKGVGNAMAGLVLTELNPYRARHASSFWKYAGLDVHRDGTGRSNKKCHNEPTWDRVSTGTEGVYRMVKTVRKTYSPLLKSKLMGVLADKIIMAGLRWENVDAVTYDETPDAFRRIKAGKNKSCPDVKQAALVMNSYIERYLSYKHRKANSIEMVLVWRKEGRQTVIKEIRWCDTSPAHRNMAAKRVMIKTFLADLWVAWRKLEGLPVSDPYAEEMLGRAPHHDARNQKVS